MKNAFICIIGCGLVGVGAGLNIEGTPRYVGLPLLFIGIMLVFIGIFSSLNKGTNGH